MAYGKSKGQRTPVQLIRFSKDYNRRRCPNGHDASQVMWVYLRWAGDRKPIRGWFECETCTPAHFHLPETAEEAYLLHLEIEERKKYNEQHEEVIDAFLPV